MPRAQGPRCVVLTLAAIVFALSSLATAQRDLVGAGLAPPPGAGVRDMPPATRTVPVGTATLSGTVIAADTGRPVRRARVTLSGTVAAASSATPGFGPRGAGPAGATQTAASLTRGFSRSTVTDTQGQFSFDNIPDGQFTLSVNREQYLATNYGQKKPGRPGSPIAVAPGQHVDVKVTMLRTSAISGLVLADDGEPLGRVQIRALRYVMNNGVRQLQSTGGSSTDDRGAYRLFGLQPGDYVIAATPSEGDISMVERDAADAALLARALADARRAAGSTAVSVVTVPIQPNVNYEQQPAGYLPAYFPGATAPPMASVVTLAPGEERTGIDIRVLPIRATNIVGTIAGHPGGAVNIQVSLSSDNPLADVQMSSARANADGRFTLRNVSPGSYTVIAQTVPPPTAVPQVVNGVAVPQPVPAQPRIDVPALFGRARVTIGGDQPTTDVTVALVPGRTISGVVRFEMDRVPDLARNRLNVTVVPAVSAVRVLQFGPQPQAPIDPDGRFTVTGVGPGKYMLRVSGPTTKSAVVNGRDVMDFPLEVSGEEDIADVVVTLTNRLSELSGSLVEASGKPATDYAIIVAPSDTRYWTPGSRRVMVTRPSPDGRYIFPNLPAGAYILAAVTDLEPGEQYDPEFLKALVGASARVTITDGGKTTQDLRVAQ